MENLRDPWVFVGAASALVALVSYVWAAVDKSQPEPGKAAFRAAAVAVFSLALLTWLAHGQGDGGPMTTPYITE